MAGRASGVAGAVLALVALASSAAAATPEGPQLAYVRSGNPLPAEELLSADPSGTHWSRLARVPHTTGVFQDFSWSGDGTRLAVGSIFGEEIVTVPAEGGTPRPVRGTKRGFAPAFSPDGRTIAFARFRYRKRERGRRPSFSASIWLVDANGGRSRQLTPWRDDLLLMPSSFSPGRTSLLAERDRGGKASEVVSVPLDGGPVSVIVRNGAEPAYSPDGSSIAFVRLTVERRPRLGLPDYPFLGGDLFVAASDGSEVRRLTFNPARREESPSWDPSGERLAYAQRPAKRTFAAQAGTGSSIMEINSDGSCRHRLLFTYGLSYREPAWRPGPGRGAGRIAC